MTLALGMIETFGVPAALEAADAMVKAGSVTFVGYENTDLGRITVIIRGPVAEVQASVIAGVASVQKVNGGEVLSYHIIPRPQENLEIVLPIWTAIAVRQFQTGQFQQDIRFPPPLSP